MTLTLTVCDWLLWTTVYQSYKTESDHGAALWALNMDSRRKNPSGAHGWMYVESTAKLQTRVRAATRAQQKGPTARTSSGAKVVYSTAVDPNLIV